jgi:REP element-mobilizing transposase RayT
MTRPPRIEVPGGFYHVGARGNDRQPIFDDALRPLFLALLANAVRQYGWKVYAYALMTNHFHLLIQLAVGGLSAGMCELNTAFARASNARFGRINHALGRRFWSSPLESEEHLRATIAYVLWNPPRKGVGDHPRDSTWTSYRACAGLDAAPPCLAVEDVLALHGRDHVVGRDAFCRYVSDGRGRCQAP